MKKSAAPNLPWVPVEDYKHSTGWAPSGQSEAHSRAYCEMLERGQILFFREPPFDFPAADQKFLLEQEWSELRMHKNVSYRPSEDSLRGVSGDRETMSRLHSIMRNYSAQVTQFLAKFLLRMPANGIRISPVFGRWKKKAAIYRCTSATICCTWMRFPAAQHAERAFCVCLQI